MKKYLIFTVILLSNLSVLYSCGYSPYGEDIRYSLFLPEYFNYQDFGAFNYNADLFGFDYQNHNQYESNVYDWYHFTGKKVAVDEINECLNVLTLTDINSSSTNQFVRYLFKNKLQHVLQYLIMAKKCEEYSNFEVDDPWERKDTIRRSYTLFLNELTRKMLAEKDPYLNRKYAFIAIRTAYYGSEFDYIKKIFQSHFARGKKDYLYYWALFFNSFQNKDAGSDIANIMAYCPEKRYAAYYFFHEQFDLKNSLTKATSSQDIGNLYAFASVQRLDPNLDYLRKIYEHSNKSRILDFLLLREINKIEDWIYTPYYTNYLPSTQFTEFWWSENDTELHTIETLRARSEKDRTYAKQMLDFVIGVDYSKIHDVSLWNAAQIQLLFMTRNYDACLNKIEVFEKQFAKKKIISQIEKIKALCIISNQETGRAIIKEAVKPIIMKYKDDERFLFSIGRELEFRKNLPDGIAIIAFGNQKFRNRYYYDESNNSVEWRGNRLLNSGNLEYFYEYFDYLDFVYSADDLKIVVNGLNKKKKGDDFYKTIYSQLKKDENYLKDLLGTKYIRENRLEDALNAFNLIAFRYWEENYNPWERDRFDDSYTFDKNPFYDIKYVDPFIPHTERYLVTKLSITQHLIKYLKLADNPKTKNRDYYYFIIANCYLNMTQKGHSWMMRRFTSVTNYDQEYDESYIDESEYVNSLLAQKYYRLAAENSKTEKFKALCLLMEVFSADPERKLDRLKNTYPEYYQELSSCENLENYFEAR